MRCRRIEAVRNPDTRKAAVATSERGERRDSPHTPCPLVHPEPRRLPNPTSIPASNKTEVEA